MFSVEQFTNQFCSVTNHDLLGSFTAMYNMITDYSYSKYFEDNTEIHHKQCCSITTSLLQACPHVVQRHISCITC